MFHYFKKKLKKLKMIWQIIRFGSKKWDKNCEIILVRKVKKVKSKKDDS